MRKIIEGTPPIELSDVRLVRHSMPTGFSDGRPNEYGYNVGGPVYIPGHYNTDKSKTFFFWSQSWRKILNAQTMNVYVPSVRQRAGDFSECDSASGNYNAVVADGCVVPTVNGIKYDDITTAPGINVGDLVIYAPPGATTPARPGEIAILWIETRFLPLWDCPARGRLPIC